MPGAGPCVTFSTIQQHPEERHFKRKEGLVRVPRLVVLGMVLLVGDLAPEPGRSPELAGDDAGMVRVDNFYIDVFEYPNRLGALPRVDVTWAEARDLCGEQGKRLCAEAEWERAAR